MISRRFSPASSSPLRRRAAGEESICSGGSYYYMCMCAWWAQLPQHAPRRLRDRRRHYSARSARRETSRHVDCARNTPGSRAAHGAAAPLERGRLGAEGRCTSGLGRGTAAMRLMTLELCKCYVAKSLSEGAGALVPGTRGYSTVGYPHRARLTCARGSCRGTRLGDTHCRQAGTTGRYGGTRYVPRSVVGWVLREGGCSTDRAS